MATSAEYRVKATHPTMGRYDETVTVTATRDGKFYAQARSLGRGKDAPTPTKAIADLLHDHAYSVTMIDPTAKPMTQGRHLELVALLDAIIEAIELDESFDLDAHMALTVSLESLKAAREHHKQEAATWAVRRLAELTKKPRG